LKTLATFRAQSEPRVLQNQAARIWEQRWLILLGVAVQDALAATLVDEGSRFLNGVASIDPLSVDVWLDGLRSYGTLPTGGGNNGTFATEGIVANMVRESNNGTLATDGSAANLESRESTPRGMTAEELWEEEVFGSPSEVEMESIPAGSEVGGRTTCENPYPGGGRLNTLTHD
jgi:hypothetical protein